jgi:hypothetical protein
MPIREFECPKHGTFEKIVPYDFQSGFKCPKCKILCPEKEWSAPAKRNSDYGLQR